MHVEGRVPTIVYKLFLIAVYEKFSLLVLCQISQVLMIPVVSKETTYNSFSQLLVL